MPLIILGAIVLVALLYIISDYNALASMRAHIQAAMQEIGNQLKRQAALATLPALMQLVQTRIRLALPLGVFTRIDCRLGLKTRGVRLLACETLLPNCGPLPQTSQRFAMMTDLLTGVRRHSVDRRDQLKRNL